MHSHINLILTVRFTKVLHELLKNKLNTPLSLKIALPKFLETFLM